MHEQEAYQIKEKVAMERAPIVEQVRICVCLYVFSCVYVCMYVCVDDYVVSYLFFLL